MWTGFAASDGDTIQIAFNVDDQGLYIGVNNKLVGSEWFKCRQS